MMKKVRFNSDKKITFSIKNVKDIQRVQLFYHKNIHNSDIDNDDQIINSKNMIKRSDYILDTRPTELINSTSL